MKHISVNNVDIEEWLDKEHSKEIHHNRMVDSFVPLYKRPMKLTWDKNEKKNGGIKILGKSQIAEENIKLLLSNDRERVWRI